MSKVQVPLQSVCTALLFATSAQPAQAASLASLRCGRAMDSVVLGNAMLHVAFDSLGVAG